MLDVAAAAKVSIGQEYMNVTLIDRYGVTVEISVQAQSIQRRIQAVLQSLTEIVSFFLYNFFSYLFLGCICIHSWMDLVSSQPMFLYSFD